METIVSKQLTIEITKIVFKPNDFLFNSRSIPIANPKNVASNSLSNISISILFNNSIIVITLSLFIMNLDRFVNVKVYPLIISIIMHENIFIHKLNIGRILLYTVSFLTNMYVEGMNKFGYK